MRVSLRVKQFTYNQVIEGFHECLIKTDWVLVVNNRGLEKLYISTNGIHGDIVHLAKCIAKHSASGQLG